ncbi:S1C family serine protease [Schumannella luteola]
MSDTPETRAEAPVEAPVQYEATPINPEEHPALAKQATPKRAIGVGVIAALAVGALVGGVSGAGVTLWATSLNAGNPVATTASPTTITVNDADDATLITAVAAEASPSVVTLSVSSESAGGTGSGVVLSEDGYILTNAHVVTLDGAVANPTIKVQTNDGRLLDATVVGVDPIYDLAVVKVDGVNDLQPATFADSSKLNVGDTAIAIGAPLGLAGTVTNGIVSALNRSITVASSAVPDESDTQEQAPDGETPFDFWNFDLGQGDGQQSTTTASSTISLSVIQTDAAINPGNSGGALLNSDGEVIGINVAIASAGSSSGQSGSIGVGFAIPSNIAQRVADELIANGTATHGLLGASVADVTEDTNQTDAEVVGASIVELVSGGAAEAAGLKVGDIVTAVDGLPVTGKTDLTAQIRALAAGSQATITYVRDGKAYTADVTLGTLQ